MPAPTGRSWPWLWTTGRSWPWLWVTGGSWPWLWAAAGAGLFLVAWAVLTLHFPNAALPDTPIYAQYAAQMRAGLFPYRDFAVVYPPVALPAFLLPALLAGTTTFHPYNSAFGLLMAPCGAGAVATAIYLLARQTHRIGRLLAGLALAGVAPLLIGPLILSRYDSWPALLTTLALALIVFGRSRVGFGILALAVGAKAYPLAVLPILTIYVWRNLGGRRALSSLATFVAVLVCVIAPFAILAPHGLWASVKLQTSRPLQLESLGASLMLVAHQIGGVHLAQVISDGSDNLVGTTAGRLASASGWLQVAVIVAITLQFLRGPATRERTLFATAAAICAFVALDRVLSPQYLIWLIPLVIALPRLWGVAASALLAATLVLTQLWFPSRYFQLVAFAPLPSWLVFSRDMLLLVLLGTLVWPLRVAAEPTRRRAPRSSEPATETELVPSRRDFTF